MASKEMDFSMMNIVSLKRKIFESSPLFYFFTTLNLFSLSQSHFYFMRHVIFFCRNNSITFITSHSKKVYSCLSLSFKHSVSGAPAVAQQDWQHLRSSGTQVPSLAGPSRLRIQSCHSYGLGRDYG